MRTSLYPFGIQELIMQDEALITDSNNTKDVIKVPKAAAIV
jgi:hypothetical protein